MKNIFSSFIFIILCCFGYTYSFAKNNSFQPLQFDIIEDSDIQNSISSFELVVGIDKQKINSEQEFWQMEGFTRVQSNIQDVFYKGQEYERIEATSKLINVFSVSKDRSQFTVGLKVWPFGEFSQTIKVTPNSSESSFDLIFSEGIFQGLQGQLILTSASLDETDVWVKISGTVATKNIPFVVTTMFLQTASKEIGQRLQKSIENDKK